jgi:predicted transposase/invertase (TIGR01784 family)
MSLLPMSDAPHDALFKQTFGQPDVARSELELVLPAGVVAHLDLSTLALAPGSFVDAEYRQVHSDLLFTASTRGGGDALIYILFEHQSSPDRTMPFRLLRYIVRVWERWLREQGDRTPLPLVLPVVLHHDEGRWTWAPELASMLDASPELLEATRAYVPHFRFVLDDLAALSPEELASRALDGFPKLVQLALWASRSLRRLRRAAPLMGAVAVTIARDGRRRSLLHELVGYILSATPDDDIDKREIRTILGQIAGPEDAEDVMTLAERLIQEGREVGRSEGHAEGLRTGILAALSARSISISEVGRARLATCTDVAALTAWLTRAVTATSESDVFGG